MVKQRMSTADVAGETACLRQNLLGMRVANIYDVNPKTYIIKLSRSGEDAEKAHLVLESGTRFHTTQYMKEKADAPSNFTLKLRKHLRTRRLDEVKQLGVDRVVDFSFGTGEACYHLILELYAQGNVILTDANYEILTLLRSHRDDNKGISFMARHAYPIHSIRLYTPLEMSQLESALESADEKQNLRGALAGVMVHGPAVCEHCIATAQLQASRKPKREPLSEPELAALFQAVQEWEAWLQACETSAPEGFIAARRTGDTDATKAKDAPPGSQEAAAPEVANGRPDDGLVYESYDPLRLKQNEGRELLPFPTFDAALDEFYAKIEGQKAEQARRQQEQAALSKLEKIRLDQTQRAQTLEEEARDAEQKATVIEINAEAVDGAINAVRGALAQGLSWAELERLIRDERDAGNPVASLIRKLSLDKNKITVELPDWVEEGLEDTESDIDEDSDDDRQPRQTPTVMVEVDLDMNAHANARAWHGDRKARTVKQHKTIEANKKALAVADKKVQIQLSKVKAVNTTQQLRKPQWFEKFNWFVTSENHLVLSGRDAQQNELLVKRYLRKDDLYVHADLHGAATTIIRNNDPMKAVPPFSISQAGAACVCRSQAWDAKIVTSAWWVHASQVSKAAPSGEYLPTGSFMIRGKKNFLPPHPLVMGLSFLFKLDESSLAGHLGERAPRTADDEGADVAEDTAEDAVDVPEDADGSSTEDEVEAAQPPAEAENGVVEESSSNALEAFLDSAPDPFRARPPGSSKAALGNLGRQDSRAPGQYSKYGLDAPGSASTGQDADGEGEDGGPALGEPNGVDDQGESGAPRRHLSAAERKALRKGRETDGSGPPGAEPAADPGLEAARKAERERRTAKAAAQEEAEAAAALARGKRSKLKRAKTKYAHQDEEDRQLALEVLAPAGKKKSTKEKRELRKAKKRDPADATVASARKPTPEELAAAGARLGPRAQAEAEERAAAEDAAAAAEQVSSSSDESSSEGSVEEQHIGDLKAEDSKDAKEIAAILAAENVELVAEEDREKLQELDSLTGQPRATDILLYALPMCAPYNALQNYKLKVKMTPGSQRKGRAARQAVELLARAQDATAREKKLLQQIPETEVISAMMGNVKLAMPGLSKLVTEQRKGKKKKA